MSLVQEAIELLDRVSGPAKTMAASMKNIASGFTAADAAVEKFNRDAKLAGSAGGAVGSKMSGVLSSALGTVESASGSAGAGLAKLAAISGGVEGVVGTLTDKLIGLGTRGFGLIAAGAGYAAEMASFKENTLFAMKNVTGSQAGAVALFEQANRMARTLGGDTQDISTQLLGLRQRGFGQRQAEGIVMGMADLKASNRGANVEGIITQIGQVKSLDKLTYENLQPILEAGAPGKEVFDELRKLTNSKDNAEAMKALAAGKVSGSEGINAILRAIETKGGGPLGSVAEAFSKSTVDGAVDNMKARFKDLFLSIDSSPAGKAIADIANRLANLFDPANASGQRLLGIFDRGAKLAGMMLDSLDGGALGQALEIVTGAVDGVVTAFEAAWPYVKAFGEGLWEGIQPAIAPLKEVWNSLKDLGGDGPLATAKDAFRSVGIAVGFAAGLIVDLVAAFAFGTFMIIDAVGQIINAVGELGAGFAGVVGDMWNAGSSLVSGIWEGIKSGWASLISGFESLVEMLPATVKSALGIASPSRVMAELGGYTAEGFAVGIDSQYGAVQGAMSDLVAPPNALAGMVGSIGVGAGASGASLAGGGRFGDVSVTINVEAHGDIANKPEAFAIEMRREFTKYFDEINLEMGAEMGASL